MKQASIPKKIRMTLLSELSKFAWLELNKCGDVVSCKDHSKIIWRIGSLKVRNGKSVVRTTLEYDSYGDKLPISFLDETGPIGPSKPMGEKIILNNYRWDKQVKIWESYNEEQKAFFGAVNRLVEDLFCDSGYKSDRIEECFCIATLKEHNESVYVFQAIKKPEGKESRILERKLEDWKFENTDLSYDTSDMVESEKTDCGEVKINRLMVKLTNLYQKIVDSFSVGKFTIDLSDLEQPLIGGSSYSWTDHTESVLPESEVKMPRYSGKKKVVKRKLFSHKKSKVRTLYLLLSTGKALSTGALAEAIYGNNDPYHRHKLISMISKLRTDGNYNIVVEKGKYRLILGDD